MDSYILQVSLYLVFFLVGYWIGVKFSRPTPPKQKDLSICSCSHKYSMHNDKGKCQVAVIKRLNYQDREFGCACVRYDGIPPGHVFMKEN